VFFCAWAGGFATVGALTRTVKLLKRGEGSCKSRFASGLRREPARRLLRSVKNAAFASGGASSNAAKKDA
jgi:hypothetical protein